jgi:16S rRNA U1498 N3-methylase RsmE
MHGGRYPEQIERMFDVMLCLPRSAWQCVLKEVDKKIGTAALRKIILHACNQSDTQMLERLKRGVALLDRENKRKARKPKAAQCD